MLSVGSSFAVSHRRRSVHQRGSRIVLVLLFSNTYQITVGDILYCIFARSISMSCESMHGLMVDGVDMAYGDDYKLLYLTIHAVPYEDTPVVPLSCSSR